MMSLSVLNKIDLCLLPLLLLASFLAALDKVRVVEFIRIEPCPPFRRHYAS